MLTDAWVAVLQTLPETRGLIYSSVRVVTPRERTRCLAPTVVSVLPLWTGSWYIEPRSSNASQRHLGKTFERPLIKNATCHRSRMPWMPLTAHERFTETLRRLSHVLTVQLPGSSRVFYRSTPSAAAPCGLIHKHTSSSISGRTGQPLARNKRWYRLSSPPLALR